MKKTDKQELRFVVQYLIVTLQEAGTAFSYLKSERRKGELEEVLKELPKGKQFKAYNQKIETIVTAIIDGKMYIPAGITKLEAIEQQL